MENIGAISIGHIGPNPKLIWDTLSRIDVNPFIELKANHSYLSWASAWALLMEHFPDSKFSFDRSPDGTELFRYPDETCEVRCALTVNGITRVMWLPVMDHRNNAIKNPNARAVNDTKMRCLVKAMALFGLGHYVYAGEEHPIAARAEKKEEDSTSDIATLTDAMRKAASLDDLKKAFARASKYAKNRNDDELLQTFTQVKDAAKEKLA